MKYKYYKYIGSKNYCNTIKRTKGKKLECYNETYKHWEKSGFSVIDLKDITMFKSIDETDVMLELL